MPEWRHRHHRYDSDVVMLVASPFALAALAPLAVAAAVSDLRTHRVPLSCTLGGLICSAVIGWQRHELELFAGLVAGLLAAFLSMFLLGGRIGGADILWSGIIGAVAPVAVLVTWVMLVALVVVVTRRGRPVGLPLVPLLVLAGTVGRPWW
ncbi:hypothetical protein EPN42_04740 [bacterium]|nr:MAG: hypothetical protein EPN42_04740 [bacterium]